MLFGVIAAIVGAAVTVYGQISGASARADAEKKNAELKNTQADELLSREAINEQIMRDRSPGIERAYSAAASGTGREGASLGGIIKIHKDLQDSLINSRRDADFKAQMLRTGAEIDTKLASDTMTAGYISGAGTILSGVGKAIDAATPTKSLATV